MYVTYTRIYGWSDYGGESSYQPGYRLENMMWMTLLVYDYIIPGEKIDGIVCMNDGMATGVRQVMRDNGVLGTIPIYSNDCEENTLQAIEAGEQSGSFDMNAEAQCTAALDAMANLIAGEKIEEKEIYVDPLLVTKDNLEEYRASHSDNY